MPLSSTLVASVVSAVIETIVQTQGTLPAQYDTYAAKRILPPEAKVGYMLPPPGNGSIVIDDQQLRLSPVAQFRNRQNLIVMPMSVRQPSNVIFINDNFGNVRRVWLISQTEADSIKKN